MLLPLAYRHLHVCRSVAALGLMFSQNDVLEDVLNNLHVINDEFVSYLSNKVEATQDMEERLGLSSLLQVTK